MADAVSTFKSVCRGGLNTGSDVLSLGEESPGSAIQLVNYEPNLEGGYRRLSGFANNMGTIRHTSLEFLLYYSCIIRRWNRFYSR